MPTPTAAPASASSTTKPGLGLRTKLFAVLILMGAAVIAGTSLLGYTTARASLEAAILNHLVGVREAQAHQIEDYFTNIRKEVSVICGSRLAPDAITAFSAAVKQLDAAGQKPEDTAALRKFYEETYIPQLRKTTTQEIKPEDYLPVTPGAYALQLAYLVNNPQPHDRRMLVDRAPQDTPYNTAHAAYHPFFRRFVEQLEFYDLYLIDPDGRVIYSVMKEYDFGTNLFIGPYRTTSLATAALQCKARAESDATCFEDYTPYPPSLNKPSAFVTAPVFDQARTLIGILAVELSIVRIDREMSFNHRWEQSGLGKTGECFLVGPDHKLRSSPRLFIEEKDEFYRVLPTTGVDAAGIEAIRRANTPILSYEVRNRASEAALSGAEGVATITAFRGTPVLVAYRPLNIQGVQWAVIAKLGVDEAFAPVDALRTRLLIVAASALLLVLLGAALLSTSLLRPLLALTDGAQRMSQGELNVNVPVQSRDEVGQLCDSFNTMVASIRDKTVIIEQKNRENESLLLNILPGAIADRLRGGEEKIADRFAEVSVLFSDIVGFTPLSSEMPAHEIVDLLNNLFSRFDRAAAELGIEKIKTVGDAYMAVCGIPLACEDHAFRMVQMGMRMIHITREYSAEKGVKLQLRIGINSGPVVAGVIGRSKFIYDLWGDTVNIASRMESHGIADAVQATRATYDRVNGRFPFERRGDVEVKGKGKIETWVLKV